MDINEKAKDYAGGKATAAIEQAIADAYADGYKDGYHDRDNEIPAIIKKVVDTEFVDLGLPSGTLWSAQCLLNEDNRAIEAPFIEASKYNLPTKEQVEELKRCCTIEQNEIVGLNGNRIEISLPGHIYYGGYWLEFWTSTDYSDYYKYIGVASSGENITWKSSHVGLKHYILQVRTK